MPSISRFFGIVITMYFTDHARAHFHAAYAEHFASFDIESLELLAGSMPRRQLRQVQRWARQRQPELQANWDRIKAGKSPVPIEPLS